MTFREVEQIYLEALTTLYNKQEAGSLAWLSICHVCKFNRSEYLNLKNTEIPTDQYESLLIDFALDGQRRRGMIRQWRRLQLWG